jgi:hypothetical protein
MMPAAFTGAPGERHRESLRERGLEAPASEELRARRRFRLDDQVSTTDWHAVERSRRWGTYRWSGPAPTAMIVLPVATAGACEARLQLLNFFGVDLSREVTLAVGGRQVEFTLEAGGGVATRLKARLDGAMEGPLRVEITVARMRCPHFESGSADVRWLGVCVNWIEVAPAGAEATRAGLLRWLPAARR